MTAAFPTQSIGDWIFDLDNTIYPAKTNLFRRVSVRITEFVARIIMLLMMMRG